MLISDAKSAEQNALARAEYERGLSAHDRERHLATICRIIADGTDPARIEPYLATVPSLFLAVLVERGVMDPEEASGADASHGLPEAPTSARAAEEGQRRAPRASALAWGLLGAQESLPPLGAFRGCGSS